MKFKITILAENDKPTAALKGVDDVEEQVKMVWQAFLNMMTAIPSGNQDKATVLSVELVEDEE